MKEGLSIQPLSMDHAEEMWRINEEGLPGVGKVTPADLTELLKLSAFSMGAFHGQKLVGFVLCLLPGTTYKSLNYRWFDERFNNFLYVDRIAIEQDSRNSGTGSALYHCVKQHVSKGGTPVAAEVNLSPPNPGSMRFHARHGFNQVGVLEHPTYTVAMLMTS